MNQKLIASFLKKGYLLSPDCISSFTEDFDCESFIKKVDSKINSKDKPLVLTKDLFLAFKELKKPLTLNWFEFEKSRSMFEKGKDVGVYNTFLEIINHSSFGDGKQKISELLQSNNMSHKDIIEKEKDEVSSVVVIKSYDEKSTKKEVEDFVGYFRLRYNLLGDLLQKRPELQNSISIARTYNKKLREPVSIIGMISDKKITKNGNLIMVLEDFTGTIKGRHWERNNFF